VSRRRRFAQGIVVLGVLAGGAGAALLLSTERHRASYLRMLPGSAPTTATERSTSSINGSGAARGVSASPGWRARVATVSPIAAITPGRRVPRPDATGRIRIPVTDGRPTRLPAEGVPPGWQLKELAGRAVVEVMSSDFGHAMRLRSARTSFVLYRDVIVDLQEHPLLAWSWKVSRLPARGDVRHRATDDQAAQVYVVFPRWPSPLSQSDVIGYIWDTRAPAGTQVVSSKAKNVKIIVLRSGRTALNTWRSEERNVATDYALLFGRPPPRVGLIALMTDSDDTRGEAEATFADLRFFRKDGDRSKTPTSMLR